MDAIYLNGLEFYGYHGAIAEENRLGQRFTCDVVLGTQLRAAGRSDDLSKTVNYAEAYELIREIMEGTPVQLLETLAERIANGLLSAFATVEQVKVKVTKLMPPIPGKLGGVAVEIVRERSR